jgi:hypothetical protein
VFAELVIAPERLERGEPHELRLRAVKPGSPVDGQVLFRRRFVLVE